MTRPRLQPAAPAGGVLRHGFFGWAPRFALLATFVLGVLAPLRVARTEGETEWKEQRVPVEEEVEAAHKGAIRSAQRGARGNAAVGVFVLGRAPKQILPRVEPLDLHPQQSLPRRTGPPDDEDDLG